MAAWRLFHGTKTAPFPGFRRCKTVVLGVFLGEATADAGAERECAKQTGAMGLAHWLLGRSSAMWVWVKKGHPKWNPSKWKQGPKPAVPWWCNFEPYPCGNMFSSYRRRYRGICTALLCKVFGFKAGLHFWTSDDVKPRKSGSI